MVTHSGNQPYRISWQLICLLTLFLLSTNAHAQTNAYIKLQIDSREVFFGDNIVLEVESTGLLDPIDLSPVLEQATLVRETTGTRIAVFSGKIAQIKIQRINLQPKKSGTLVIGPLLAGDISSNSVHVKVSELTRSEWQPPADAVQIKTTVSPETVRVNQQVELSIELLHRYPVSGETITLPTLQQVSKRDILTDRRTFKDDTKEWRRTEWKYLLYPRESGTLDLGSIKWTGTLLKSRIERADFERSVDAIKLDVRPAAVDQGDWWLPSENVKLTEAWSEPPTSLRAGDELQRTITIEATSVLSGQIPTPVITESRALKQTLINTRREEALSSRGVTSKAVFTYRVKAQSPIPVFMDTVRVPWWDTAEENHREAIIPARRINVGLPDRADLLSEAALQETGVNRIQLFLQSTGWLRLGIYALAAFCLTMLGRMLFQVLSRRAGRSAEINIHITHLRAAVSQHNATELHRLLRSPVSKRLFGVAHHRLLQDIEGRLFSDNQSLQKVVFPADIQKQITEIKRTAKSNHQATSAPRRQALAEI